MNAKKLLILLIFCCASISSLLKASHFTGGYINYKHDSANSYSIYYHLYRDCRGVSFDSKYNNFLIIFKGNGINKWFKISGSRISIKDASLLKNGEKSSCLPVNTYGTGQGIEEHIYVAKINFNDSTYSSWFDTANFVEFGYTYCCLTYSGTPPPDPYFYSKLFLRANGKKLGIVNNSAVQPYKNPTFICCNNASKYSFAVHDTLDSDSFVYRLEAVFDGPSGSISYSSPFSYKYPITPFCLPLGSVSCTPNPTSNPPKGFFMDTSTGMMIFTPTKCDEVAPIGLRVDEFRKISGKYVLIGQSHILHTYWVSNCGYNKSPKAIDISGDFTLHVEKPNTFKLTSDDELFAPYQTTDTTDIFFPNAPFGAEYKRDSVFNRIDKGTFTWNPDSSWLGRSFRLVYAVKDRSPNSIATAYVKSVLLRFRGPFSKYSVTTYHDKNRNGKKETSEPIIPFITVGVKNYPGAETKYLKSDKNGIMQIGIFHGVSAFFNLPGEKYSVQNSTDSLRFFGHDTLIDLKLGLVASPYVTGKLYFDNNKNCSFDTSDRTKSGLKIYSPYSLAETDDSGKFTLYLDTVYTDLNTGTENRMTTCDPGGLDSFLLKNDSFVLLGNIPLEPSFDVGLGLASGIPRRGAELKVKLDLENNSSARWGYFTGGSFPKLYLAYTKKLEFVSATDSGNVDTAAGIVYWNSKDLGFGKRNIYEVKFKLPVANFAVGDDIFFQGSFDSSYVDSVGSNDIARLDLKVRGPLDPNEKSLYSRDSMPAAERLVYRIDFENMGTDTAFNVVVTDSLSGHIAPGSLQLLDASAACNLKLRQHVLYFHFADIMLPDSGHNKEGSKGFVIFSAALKENLPLGTQIKNSAEIFFDHEKGVKTNTVTTTILPVAEVQVRDTFFCRNAVVTLDARNNVYTRSVDLELQISDGKGDFANARILKTMRVEKDVKNWTIQVQLPDDLVSGLQYRFRLVPLNIDNTGEVPNSRTFAIEKQVPDWSLDRSDYCENMPMEFSFGKGNYGKVFLDNTLVLDSDTTISAIIGKSMEKNMTLRVEGVTAAGCPWKDTGEIVAFALPEMQFQVPAYTCENVSYQLNISDTNTWNVNQNGMNIYSNVSKGNWVISPQNTVDSIVLISSTDKGCIDSLSVAVETHELPVFTLFVPEEICKGDTVFLELKSGVDAYEIWKNGQQIYSGLTGFVALPASNPSQLFLVQGTNNDGCFRVDSIFYPMIEDLDLKWENLSQDDQLCTGDKELFEMSGLDKADLWINGLKDRQVMASDAITFSWSSAGTYEMYVNGESELGCTYSSDTQRISVFNLPPKPLVFKRNDSLFTDASLSTTWYYENMKVALGTNFIEPFKNGNYWVKVKNSNDCENMSDSFLVAWTGVGVTESVECNLYPNPFNDRIYFASAKAIERIQAFNAVGEMIDEWEVGVGSGSVDAGQLNAGVFFIRVVFKDGSSENRRMIKEK